MSEINPGDKVRVTTAPGFTNGAGELGDPATVRLRWRVFSDDVETVWTYGIGGQVVKDSTGVYHADIPITVAGTYTYRWEGEGTIDAAEEGSFRSVTQF